MSPRSRATDIGPEGKAWPWSRVLSPGQPPDLPFQTPSCLTCFLEKYSWPCVKFPHSDSNVLEQTFQRHGINSSQDDQACSLWTVEDIQVLVIQWCPILCDPWTVAHQVPLSMGFSRKEYWSGLPFPPPEDLLDLGIEPRSPALQADSLPSEPPWFGPNGSDFKTLKKYPVLPTQLPIWTLPEDKQERFPFTCMETGVPYDKEGMMPCSKDGGP